MIQESGERFPLCGRAGLAGSSSVLTINLNTPAKPMSAPADTLKSCGVFIAHLPDMPSQRISLLDHWPVRACWLFSNQD